MLGDTADGGEDGQPAGPGGVVTAQPVHHRDRGRGHAAPDRDRAARVFPAAAPLTSEGQDPVPLARQRGGRDQVLVVHVGMVVLMVTGAHHVLPIRPVTLVMDDVSMLMTMD